MKLPLNLYTASQVRELDRIAINDFSISGFSLMKRAGQATFEIIHEAYSDAKKLCVVCGTGNNGGDGYVIATLAIAAGYSVNIIQLGQVESITGDAMLARNDYLHSNGKELTFDDESLNLIEDSDVIVDAIFGTGLSRDITGKWAVAIEAINQSKTINKTKTVAVDIPSGLNADTGSLFGLSVKADITVTYIGLKSGLFTGKARDYTGNIKFNDLDIPKEVYQVLSKREASQVAEPKTEQINKQLIPAHIIQDKLKPRSRISHKGSHGHVLLIGGAQGMSGAIRLAGEAALRAGSGLVSIATDVAHADIINLTRPELMVTGVEQGEALLPLIEKANVIVIGPGLGTSDWAKTLLKTVLKSNKPKVLDADALNLLANSKREEQNKNNRGNNWILTPHPAEAARLLGVKTNDIEKDRYKSIHEIVKNRGGGCILKGAGSLVSDGNVIRVCNAGNPGMASGGMGDVLSGIVAALLAQGLSLLDAASVATQIHAQAADLVAVEGERGLLASDLFPHIRQLVN